MAPARADFDAVVIGSGFGGAVTACKLAEEGWRVLVLERGRPYPPGSLPRTPRDIGNAFWDPEAARHGLVDLWTFSGMNVVLSAGLGGGSLIYANVMLRKPPETFVNVDGERWPVSRVELDPHYDNVEAVQRPERYPIDRAPYDKTRKTRALLDAAHELGMEVENPPLAIVFASSPGEDPVPRAPIVEDVPSLHGLPRITCTLCGECDTGCNYGAKQTLDHTYLSRAVASGAEIRTLCDARLLTEHESGWTVTYRQHVAGLDGVAKGLRDPVAEERRTVTARHVVLGAGAIGSTSLLLRNRASLPDLSPALGHGVSANGDMMMFVRNARLPNGGGWRYLDPSVGPVITTSVRVPGSKLPSGREHYVQDGGAPAWTEWLWQMLEGPGDLWQERGVAWRRLKERLTGHRDSNFSDEVARGLGQSGMSAAMMPMLGMGRDIPDARLHLNHDGALDMAFDPSASMVHYDALRKTGRELAEQMGAEWSEPPAQHTTSVHPVGGCAMSVNPLEGVVDPWGNVHGHPGLHVADGAVMPGPVGPNPSFTIAALADRFAEAMIEAGRP